MKHIYFLITLFIISFSYAQKQTISVNIPADSITFAIIGDFGQNTKEEGEVADMIRKWGVDFIITTGDDNYFLGQKKTIVRNIGKYYCDFIYNPDAPAKEKCNGLAAQERINRFFPCPGNHDNYSIGLYPYLKYFTLPGNEKDYTFIWGPIQFYSINSGLNGNLTAQSKTANWLHDSLSRSTSTFKFVYFHHPPYSTGEHGNAKKMQWPYGQWGVDAVLTGHEHFYERIKDNTSVKPVYITCGSSGNTHLYGCNIHPLDSIRFQVRCDDKHYGAIKVRATSHMVIFEYFIATEPDKPLDVYFIRK